VGPGASAPSRCCLMSSRPGFTIAYPCAVTVQVVAGILTFPLVSSVRTSKGRRPCAAVDRQERIAAKPWAPARMGWHPDTFCLILTMRMSRPAGVVVSGPIDDQVGDRRAGRLVLGAIDELDPCSDYWATDAGIYGAGASAEEAAIHVVRDSFPSDD
jgi:Family of unknown function (DUF5709)